MKPLRQQFCEHLKTLGEQLSLSPYEPIKLRHLFAFCDVLDERKEGELRGTNEATPAQAQLLRAATLIENLADAVDDPVFVSQAKEEAVRIRSFTKCPVDAGPKAKAGDFGTGILERVKLAMFKAYCIRMHLPEDFTLLGSIMAKAWEDAADAALVVLIQERDAPSVVGFNDGLVERLYDGPYLKGQVSVPDNAGNAAGRLVMRGKASIRNILAELAKMPVELPTETALLQWFSDGSNSASAITPEERRGVRQVKAVMDNHVVPVLAARNARIAELKSKVEHAETDAENLSHELNDARKRTAELEENNNTLRATSNPFSNAVARVGKEALADVGRLERELDEAMALLSESKCVAPGRTIADAVKSILGQLATQGENLRQSREHVPQLAKERDEAKARIAELEAQVEKLGGWDRYENIVSGRVAELEKQLVDQAPKVKEWHDAIDALSEAWPRGIPYKDNPTHAEWIRDLVAVLGNKTKQQTMEALQQVRERITADGEVHEYYRDIIDDELAKLGATPEPIGCAHDWEPVSAGCFGLQEHQCSKCNARQPIP
jgi:uncharacterized membrane protein